MNKITNERGEITTNTTETKIIKGKCEQLHAKKLGSLEEMDKFLEHINYQN